MQESTFVNIVINSNLCIAYASDDALAVSRTTYSSYSNLVACVDERPEGRKVALFQIDFDPGWGNIHWSAAIDLDYLVSSMYSIDSSNLIMVGRKVNDLAFIRVSFIALKFIFRFV